MNCTEVLATLSTASLRDMTPDSDVMLHCDNCPDCARVTTMLRDREYEAATLLNGLPPLSNPIAIAEQSVIASKRRRVGRVAVIMSGAALIITIWIAAALTVIPALNEGDVNTASSLHTETMQLSCLSPQQAADIINPYVRSHEARTTSRQPAFQRSRFAAPGMSSRDHAISYTILRVTPKPPASCRRARR